LSPEIRELIATMASQNPLWGAERIRGELLKARNHRQRPIDPTLSSAPHSSPPSQSWRNFLANHAEAIWAADLFVVQTLTFQTLC